MLGRTHVPEVTGWERGEKDKGSSESNLQDFITKYSTGLTDAWPIFSNTYTEALQNPGRCPQSNVYSNLNPLRVTEKLCNRQWNGETASRRGRLGSRLLNNDIVFSKG